MFVLLVILWKYNESWPYRHLHVRDLGTPWNTQGPIETRSDFNRIQFTPDLMPADISGTDIIQEHGETGKREFEFVKGPVFSNIVLADEINRAPAKTQSAMLEAMQERHVTVLGRTYKLDAPFFVLATQNPVEQEGTYPLPEAQLDRFMFLINVEYPSAQEEKRIARETTGVDKEPLNALLTGEEVLKFQSLVRRVPVPDHIYDYAVEIVRRTRPDGPDAPDWIKEYVGWGASCGPVSHPWLQGPGSSAGNLHGFSRRYWSRCEPSS